MNARDAISFRPASPPEVPRICEIIASIYADYGDVLDVEREDPHLKEPCSYFRQSGGELWVAVGASNPSGKAVGVGGSETPEKTGRDCRATQATADADLVVAGSGGVVFRPDEAEIKTIYVAHEFRRRGIARRLVTLAIDFARQSRGDDAKIMLWSDTRFVEAHALYESLGFVRGVVRHVKITNSFSEYRYDLIA